MTLSQQSASSMSPKKERTKEAILEAAHSIFASKTIDRVSVDEIAKIVGVSKGSFYNYFGDRDALALAVWEKIQYDLEAKIVELNKDVSDAPRRVTRALSYVLKDAVSDRKRMQALFAISERDSSTETPINFGAVSDIRMGISTNKFKNIDVETGMMVINGMMTTATKHVIRSEVTLKQIYMTSTKVGAAILRALGLTQAAAYKISERSAREVLMSGFDAVSISET